PMQCLGRIYLGGDDLLAELDLHESARGLEPRFHVHPAKLDASTLLAFARTPLLEEPFIPISIAAARLPRSPQGRCYVHVPHPETHAPSGDVMHNDYRIYDAGGRLAAELTRLTCKRIRSPELITALVAPPLAGDEPSAQLAEHIR